MKIKIVDIQKGEMLLYVPYKKDMKKIMEQLKKGNSKVKVTKNGLEFI